MDLLFIQADSQLIIADRILPKPSDHKKFVLVFCMEAIRRRYEFIFHSISTPFIDTPAI